jgi:hypothetical protein
MSGRVYSVRGEEAKYGASFGSALATAISYTTNHSILGIIHGILSWLYVIYFAPFRGSFRRDGEPCPARETQWRPAMGGTADHRRLSVDDALAPETAVRMPPGERVKATLTGSSSEPRLMPEPVIAGAHSMTSSARASSDCEIVSPSAFAVFKLITSSNLFGFWTGRSAGLAPFRM